MSDASMDSHFRELDEQGYTILKDMLAPRQIDEAITACKKATKKNVPPNTNPAPNAPTT